MRASRAVVCVLSFLTGAGIIVQWSLVYSGLLPVTESVPGFRNYFLSFVAADLWLILAAFMTGTFILLRDQRALLSGVALGSAMVFFGLYSLMYDLNTGLLVSLSADELFGKGVTLYNLMAGIFFMLLSWKDRQLVRTTIDSPS